MLYAILFMGKLGADVAHMEPAMAIGPFPTLELCAAAGALGINSLNTKYPDKDFRIDCSPTNKVERRPGAPLYDLRALAAIAGAPFDMDKQ